MGNKVPPWPNSPERVFSNPPKRLRPIKPDTLVTQSSTGSAPKSKHSATSVTLTIHPRNNRRKLSLPSIFLLNCSPMRFGSLELKSNLFLSPLAGYTNLPFRLTLREVGGLDLATTDLVNARSLLEGNPKAFKLIETRAED